MSQANQYYLAFVASHSCAVGKPIEHFRRLTLGITQFIQKIIKGYKFLCTTSDCFNFYQSVSQVPQRCFVNHKTNLQKCNTVTKLFTCKIGYFNELRLYFTVIFCNLFRYKPTV
jgi:hypothetical protein